MRWLTLILVVLVAGLQYPLWLGKGSWLRVWEVDQQISQQKETNVRLKARNGAMEAEVRDLKEGYDAIEERARSELGMVKPGEVFFQVLEPGTPKPTPAETKPGASEKAAPPAPRPAHKQVKKE